MRFGRIFILRFVVLHDYHREVIEPLRFDCSNYQAYREANIPLPPFWMNFTPAKPWRILPVIAGAARRVWRVIFLPRWRWRRWKAKT